MGERFLPNRTFRGNGKRGSRVNPKRLKNAAYEPKNICEIEVPARGKPFNGLG